MGVFTRFMTDLATEAADDKAIMIDATHLNAHRTDSSLQVKEGGLAARLAARRAV